MSDPLTKVITALKSEDIIPDVIPDTLKFTPSILFTLVWPDNGAEVLLGNKIPQDLTVQEPYIKITPTLAPKADYEPADTEHGGEPIYTLVMTDPDAPSRSDPKFREFRHWVLSGIKLPAPNAAETEGFFASKPNHALTSYYPPGPPPGTSFHRYVFLLFQEPRGGVEIPRDAVERGDSKESRRSWKAIDFADKYNLKLVGANFFLTEHKP